MKEIREWIDVIAKVFLAVVAAFIGYYFSFQKQQNEDIKLVVEMATAQEPTKRLMGASIAQAYFSQNRIPQDVYLAVFSYANNLGDEKLQAVVNSGAAAVSRGDKKVKQALVEAGSALPIRIYFHIRQESDREFAAKLESAIESTVYPTGNSIVVPGIQLLPGTQNKSLLKCFKKEECTSIAPKLVDMFKANNIPIELSDLSAQYEQTTTIRANHFEAWFAPGITRIR